MFRVRLKDRERIGRPLGLQLAQRVPSPEEPASYGHLGSESLLRPPEDDSRCMCLRDADKRLWFRFAETLAQILDPHAGIHHDRDRPDLQHRKRQREEVETWLHHEDSSNARADPNSDQRVGDAIRAAMQFERAQFGITGGSVGVSPVGYGYREGTWLAPGQIGQKRGHVDVVGRALYGCVGSVRKRTVRVSAHAELSICWVWGRPSGWLVGPASTNWPMSGMISSPASSRT